MARKQAQGRNSVSRTVALSGEISDQIPLPDGVLLRNDAEMEIWQQFTRTRAADGWRDFDLRVVAKAVKIEADILHYEALMHEEGARITNDKGTPIVNPLLTIIDSLQRRQLALIRSISMNQQQQDARTLSAGGKEQSRIRKAVNSFDDLIAR